LESLKMESLWDSWGVLLKKLGNVFFVFGNKLGLLVDFVSQNIKVYGLYKILWII